MATGILMPDTVANGVLSAALEPSPWGGSPLARLVGSDLLVDRGAAGAAIGTARRQRREVNWALWRRLTRPSRLGM